MTQVARLAGLLLCALLLGAAPQQLEVCAACDYTRIRDAISAASAGDTILIRQGRYQEGNLVIDKSLTLIGEEKTVLDGNHEVEILTIQADDVTIKGLTFQNSGVSHVEDLAALKTDGVSGCHIENNRFIDNFFAVYLADSKHCSVTNNQVKGDAKREAFSGNAIHVWSGYDLRIVGNTVEGHRDGIYLEFVRDSVVKDNLSQNHLRYGLHFMFSDSNSFQNNIFRRSGAGVAVMYSKNISMIGNTFEDNWGGSAYGLLLKDINDSHISGNRFERNTVGIYSDSSNRLQVERNDFVSNGYAIRVLSSSMSMLFSHNNFVANTFEVSSNGGRSYNAFVENYWSDYSGYDLDRDWVGDVAHRPVRLFTLTVENYPEAMLLMRSPLAQFMDYAERLLPVFTPKAIEDDRPMTGKIRW